MNNRLYIQLVVSAAAFFTGLGGIVAELTRDRAEQPCQFSELALAANAGEASARLFIDTNPPAVVHVDGIDTDKITPLYHEDALQLTPGTHRLTFFTTDGSAYTYLARVEAGPNALVIPTLGELPESGTAAVVTY